MCFSYTGVRLNNGKDWLESQMFGNGDRRNSCYFRCTAIWTIVMHVAVGKSFAGLVCKQTYVNRH